MTVPDLSVIPDDVSKGLIVRSHSGPPGQSVRPKAKVLKTESSRPLP